MHRRASTLVLFSIGLALSACRQATSPSSGPVLARVGDVQIRTSDFAAYLKTLPPGGRDVYPRQVLLDRLIQQKMILALARQAGLERDPGYLNQLKSFEQEQLAGLYMKRLRSEKPATQKEVRAYYNAHLDEWKTDGMVHASHIVLRTEKEASKTQALLAEGQSFEDIARKFSIDRASAEHGGKMPPFPLSKLDFRMATNLRYLDKGMVAPVIFPTPLGYELIRKDAAIEGPAKPFEAVQKEAQDQLEDQKTLQRVQDEKAKLTVRINQKELDSMVLPPS